MPTNEVADMIIQALRAMAIGIPGVFAVLTVFYISVKAMMSVANKKAKGKDNEGKRAE